MLFGTLRPAGRKTRARKYRKFFWKSTMMEPAVCVSLLGSATIGCDRMQREQAKVAHYAKVTGGCDNKTSSLASVPLMFEFTRHIAGQSFMLIAVGLVCKLNMIAEMLQTEYGELGKFSLCVIPQNYSGISELQSNLRARCSLLVSRFCCVAHLRWCASALLRCLLYLSIFSVVSSFFCVVHVCKHFQRLV